MTKFFTFSLFFILFFGEKIIAQTFAPVGVSGFNFDAVAEATTAAANTTGPIDGSDYILYSAAYGALYSVSGGLPNSGLIASGTRTYQLQTYTVNNMMYLTVGITDSLIFTTPAPYSGLSLLCFSTEGAGSMNVTVRFTDNTTQVFSNQSLTDWFGTGSSIITGFDRAGRTTGTPANTSGNPKMFNLDLVISCANRSKNIKNIKFQNTSATNPRDCIMAVSGAGLPAFSAAGSPVTCSGGSNGSASITASGGLQPYSFTWSLSPVQTGSAAANLSVGVYSVNASDAGLCPATLTVAITASFVPQPALTITANFYTVCAGSSIVLATSGVSSYTWNTAANTNTISSTPAATSVYTVGGLTSFNCYRTGSLSIVVNPLPVLSFTTPASICLNAPQLALSASPTGGNFTGQGVTFGQFYPNFAGIGSKTVSYSYTDANNCTAVSVNTILVNAIPTVNFTLSANSLCTNSSTLALSASPSGGTFSGPGVTGAVYSPSLAGAGSQTVSYSYTDANNCTASVTSSVIINIIPNVFYQTTKKLYCTFTPSLFLNASPTGGVYSGPGTSAAGAFTPASAGLGTHNLTYSYTDGNNCTGKAVLSVTVSACTGIDANKAANKGYELYPNPNNGAFSISSANDMEVSLINELGQFVQSFTLNQANDHRVSIENLSSGIYVLVGRNASEVIKQKVIVLK